MSKIYTISLVIVFVNSWLCSFADVQSRFESSLAEAGDNALQIRKALDNVPADQAEAMQFLIRYMPERDLKTLSADFLLENVEYAFKALNESAWKENISNDMFYNNILPYYCINERRDNFRKDFYARFKPLIAEAKTPGRAAVILNQKIYKLLNVKFSRRRKKPDQSPYETIESGMASCTGMSILLIEACRSVGIPARFAGTPIWSNLSGNHSWVEVWDNGWHYTGAGEPVGGKLDKAWFTERAKSAQKDKPMHAIYAASYKHTDTLFPLSWVTDNDYIHAVNVTSHYTDNSENAEVETQTTFDVEASLHAVDQLKTYLAVERKKRKRIIGQPFFDVPLTKCDAKKAVELLWNDHVKHVKQTRKSKMDAREITIGNKTMPFFYSITGDAPKGGRSLYISLHGGGGTTKRINNRQWENQKRLYQIPEGIYLAPRAPNDAWNMWFQDHIDAFFDRIIENMIVFENVNPNRVYLMGYSAGGDGLYRMAPRMADRWAAASMMAGHPGNTSMVSLFNTPFTIHVGANDTPYNRNKEARKYGDIMDKLQDENPDGYIHWTKIYENTGHWISKGADDAIPWMHNYTRNPLPKKIIWQQNKHKRFFWLASCETNKGKIVKAEINNHTINITAKELEEITVLLNDNMINLDKEITVNSGDKKLYTGTPDRTIKTIYKSIKERPDPASIFTSKITVKF